VAARELSGAVSTVPATEFEAEPLNHLIRDLAWLGPRATAHQEVNARLFKAGDAVVPLSFGAIYRDEAAIRRQLEARRAELRERLARVQGRAEWVLALERDPPRAAEALERDSAALQRLATEVRGSGAGRAFLLQRQAAELRRRETLRTDAAALEDALGQLAKHAEDAFREPVAPQTDGASRQVVAVARVSLLARRDATVGLRATVDALNQVWSPRGYGLVVTGPWPPYRFGGLQLGAGGEP
jgi:hypothetical protein